MSAGIEKKGRTFFPENPSWRHLERLISDFRLRISDSEFSFRNPHSRLLTGCGKTHRQVIASVALHRMVYRA
jgi:Fe-S cluster assembly iron-binding protein IscA